MTSTPPPAASGQDNTGLGTRRARLAALTAAPVDLLIIGGGITGAGIARDAAMRGLSTILVEQRDLGSGTSSHSSRLVHGGLRYLEQGHLGLVAEAARERATLLATASHLVWPLEFVFPIHSGDRLKLWKLAAGVWLYDLLSAFRKTRRHRILGKRAVLEAEPMLREKGLRGGARYFDAQCDDARLVLTTARSAIEHGAQVANYMPVRRLVIRDGRVAGAEVEDLATGEMGIIEAAAVLNATGPWGDAVRQMEEPGVAPLLRTTRGVHIVVPRERVGHRHAITFLSPIDGRVMFVLPWGELSYIGTTDTDTSESPRDAKASDADILYLLRSVNARFPGAHLTPDDITVTWAGLRPLVRDHAGTASGNSREHVIVTGRAGMITVAGGKLTTYRAMAASAVDHVIRALPPRRRGGWPRESGTARESLPGSEAPDLSGFRERALAVGLPADTAEHLLRLYGTESAGIINLGRTDRALYQRIHLRHPAIAAEVIHAARRELALTVEDVLVRRLHLYYELPDHGVAAAGRVAALLGRELGWDVERAAHEAARYVEWVNPL
jgi:glycerol-3-phosphate dehydrogenase